MGKPAGGMPWGLLALALLAVAVLAATLRLVRGRWRMSAPASPRAATTGVAADDDAPRPPR